MSRFPEILQADAYTGYEAIYADGSVKEAEREAERMTHLRRKFTPQSWT